MSRELAPNLVNALAEQFCIQAGGTMSRSLLCGLLSLYGFPEGGYLWYGRQTSGALRRRGLARYVAAPSSGFCGRKIVLTAKGRAAIEMILQQGREAVLKCEEINRPKKRKRRTQR